MHHMFVMLKVHGPRVGEQGDTVQAMTTFPHLYSFTQSIKFNTLRYHNAQVLKVPPTNPLAWQTALVDSEVDYILGCGFDRGKFVGKGRSAPTVRREFLRRGSGRGCAGRSTPEATGGNGDQGGATRRLNVVAGEVCPVCQEEMEAKGDGTEVTGGLRWGESLTYCRDGCGNNMHAR